jgi:signal transduction histidine kinase
LDLSSPALNEIGLAAATSEWMEEHLRRRHGLPTSFTNECGDLEMDDDVLAVLFRNTRELLANVAKHARATHVSVRFDCIDDILRITVADDGRGLAASETQHKPSDEGRFGLFSIRERMTDLGGELEIESAPGKGCTARLSLPQERLRERG